MGKPQNKKGGKNASGGTPNSKPNTPQMKKAGKQTPTPKSEQFKKVFAKEELSSDEIDSLSSNSFDEDFEALLKGPTKKTKVEEKIPKPVPAKENGQKNKQNDKAKQSPNAATPAKASPGKQTPGKADKKTPGKQPAEKITPGKKTPVKETPGKQTPGKAATPGKMEAGQKKTPAATSAVKDKQQKRKRDDSSDDEVTISTKIVKTSNTPEKATPAPQKTSPTKVASPLKSVNEKSKTPEKKVIAVQSKKRHHDESDDEEEVKEESQAKKLKAESGNGKEISANIVGQDLRFKAQVDKSVLFIKNFTKDVTEKDITALSKDIEEVQLRTIFSKKVDNQSYAYLRFKDEKTADANYKLLSNKKLCGSEIVVDYVGEKSKNKSVNKAKPLSVEDLDPLRLYIRGFSRSTREADLRKHFPKALSVTVPLKKKDNTPIGYGFAAFKTEEDCKAAHDSMQGKVIDGKILVVLFAKKCSLRKDVPTVLQPAKPKANAAAPAKTEKAAVNKKTKPAKKEEEVEEEEDDDDEDNDDSDDEDDEKDEDESDDDDDDDDEGDDDDSDDDDDEDESDDDDDESGDDDE